MPDLAGERLFLPDSATEHRRLFQGDILADVPMVGSQAFNQQPSAPAWTRAERGPAAVVAFSYDLYTQDKYELVKKVLVARVWPASELGYRPGTQPAVNVMPLPDLGDGTEAIDFSTIFLVPKDFIVKTNEVVPFARSAAMSRAGWAEMRSRLAMATARVFSPISDLITNREDIWNEFLFWTLWIDRGASAGAFQRWLNTTDATTGDTWRASLTDYERLESAVLNQARVQAKPSSRAA
jgi:hypothetical protein